MASTGLPDHYATLEVDRSADETGIKKAYRKLVLQWHPDKHPTNAEEAENRIRAINASYETLSNPFKRGQYDEQLLAMDRKKRGIQLSTSGSNPRMSIPREFMLSPMGFPEKFVRAVGRSAFVQSRAEVKVDFKGFFDDAKFSVWWLPGRNNMCRVRIATSTRSGVEMPEVGLNLAFTLQDNTYISEIGISPWPEPERTNVVAVASPLVQGAFRFEAAHFPGRYLAFRPPQHLRMIGGTVDESYSVDFMLVDYSEMTKFITAEEVLVPAVIAQGGIQEYVTLDGVRADANMQGYFRNVLGRIWADDDFMAFFESRSGEWDYDAVGRRVRLRSKLEQIGYLLRRSKSLAEVAAAISGAAEVDVSSLPLDTLETVLNFFHAASAEPVLDVSLAVNIIDAQKKIFTALSAACEKGATFRQLVAICSKLATFGGDQFDTRVAKLRSETEAKLAEVIVEHVRNDNMGGELSPILLTTVCQLPLAWNSCGDKLARLVESLLPRAVAPDEVLPLLRAVIKALPDARAASLASRLVGLAHPLWRGAPEAAAAAGGAETLEAMAGANLGAEDIAGSLEHLLRVAPFAAVAAAVAALGETGVDGSGMRNCASYVGGLPNSLQAVPPATLLRLVGAAAKSTAVAAHVLDAAAAAAAMTLASWSVEDASKLLLAMAKVKSVDVSGRGIAGLYARACEVLIPRLQDSSGAQLIKVILAIGHVSSCRQLLEAAAFSAVQRLQDLPSAQMMLLTQGMLPLGGHHAALGRLLDFWADYFQEASRGEASMAESEGIEAMKCRRAKLEGRGQLTGDQVAKLAQIVAPKAPEHGRFWEALADRLAGRGAEGLLHALTANGHASLEASFPRGEGPEFAGKRSLLREVKQARSRSRSVSKRKSRSRSKRKTCSRSKRKSRSRSKQRSRSHSRRRR